MVMAAPIHPARIQASFQLEPHMQTAYPGILDEDGMLIASPCVVGRIKY